MKKSLFIALLGMLIYSGNTKAIDQVSVRIGIADTLKADGLDPVCKMKVKAGTTKTHVHNKVVYGFCSESCKKSFAKQPEKYLKK